MKLYIVKYFFNGKKYAVRTNADSAEKAVETIRTMTRGKVYSVYECAQV